MHCASRLSRGEEASTVCATSTTWDSLLIRYSPSLLPAQLVELRAEVQEQLETVVQSYSEELSALQQQLERVEAQQAATAAGLRGPGAAAAGNASGAAASTGAASAGRAEAWRMAYEVRLAVCLLGIARANSAKR